MILRRRHATAFRTFGDRAIVTGYPLAPAKTRIRNAILQLRATLSEHWQARASRVCTAPGAPWWLALGVADALRFRRPDDPRRPRLCGVGARDLRRPGDVEAFALGIAARGITAARRAEVHVAHVVPGDLGRLRGFRAEVPHRVLVVAGQPVLAGAADGLMPLAAARMPGGADAVVGRHGPTGVHVDVALHAVVGDLDGVLALQPVADRAGTPREPHRPVGLVGVRPALVVAALHSGRRDSDRAVGLHGLE